MNDVVIIYLASNNISIIDTEVTLIDNGHLHTTHKAPHDYVVIVHLNHATRVCAALSGNDVYYLTTNNPLSRPKTRFRSIRILTFCYSY